MLGKKALKDSISLAKRDQLINENMIKKRRFSLSILMFQLFLIITLITLQIFLRIYYYTIIFSCSLVIVTNFNDNMDK